jgi:hypothetical protein
MRSNRIRELQEQLTVRKAFLTAILVGTSSDGSGAFDPGDKAVGALVELQDVETKLRNLGK